MIVYSMRSETSARQPDFQLTPAQMEEDLDFVKMRLRLEIVTAAFPNNEDHVY